MKKKIITVPIYITLEMDAEKVSEIRSKLLVEEIRLRLGTSKKE